MSAKIAALVSILALMASFALGTAQDEVKQIVGHWRGDLVVPSGALEMIFFVERDGNGWKGTVDTPAQEIFGLPLTVEAGAGEGAFVLGVPSTAGTYEAVLGDGGNVLTGEWKQRGATLELICQRHALPPPLPAALGERLAGSWEGVLDVGAVELRLVITLEHFKTGLKGHMVSIDQSPDEIPITRVDLLEEDRLRICVGSIFTTFTLDLDEEARELAGDFRQGRGTYPIVLGWVDLPSAVNRPQEPKPPFPYHAEEVVYENEAAGVTLAGTLTLPEGEGPFPAALLITGSGPQDRDETVFQHKPFWIIADHLTRRGVAVLRVDDRGVGGSTVGDDPEGATSEDFVGDVLAGVAFLTARDEIANDKIGLIGHSEGGVIAPLAATRSKDVAFIVLLAGTGIPGHELLMLQNELISRADGMDEEELQRGLDVNRRLFELILDATLSSEERQSAMREVIESSPDLSEGEEGEQEIQAVLEQLAHPWMQWFVCHDPGPVLERVRCPVLALNGTLDLQVPSKVNLEAIERALERGENQDHEVRAFETLNHLFQHCDTGQVKEYGQIEETFSPEVLGVLNDWITQRFVTER